jgi:hypothetical protein
MTKQASYTTVSEAAEEGAQDMAAWSLGGAFTVGCAMSRIFEPGEAIEYGIAIKGLAVSFASKHLRMMQPHRFAVLDEGIENGAGLAANPFGYRLVLAMLETFKRR